MKANQIDQLKRLLQKQHELPGHQAHAKIMPHRISTDAINVGRLKPKESAVMVHLFPIEGALHTVFIQRPVYEGAHSGQIALPGGKVEKLDSSLEQTAIRETQEELGIIVQQEQIIGALSPLYIPPSNFMVNPYVSFQGTPPSLYIDPREVEDTYIVSMKSLLNQTISPAEVNLGGKKTLVNAYSIKGKVLWGATAMMITELMELVRRL